MDKEKRNENTAENEPEKEESKVYEIGFLFAPTVAEEKLPEEVSALKSAIEAKGGLFISEDFPKIRSLAYTISKKINNKNQKYSQAYFGWVKFELQPSKVTAVSRSFQDNQNIIRYILVETVRENTLYAHKLAMKRDKETRSTSSAIVETDSEKVSPEELDKSIEKLVAAEN